MIWEDLDPTLVSSILVGCAHLVKLYNLTYNHVNEHTEIDLLPKMSDGTL